LNTLICKGAVDEVMSCCTRVEVKGELIEVMPEHDAKRRQFSNLLVLILRTSQRGVQCVTMFNGKNA